MGKKGTKRKTRWRTLSIGEAASEDEGGEARKANGVPGSVGSQRYHGSGGGYHHQNQRYNGKGPAGRTFSSQSTPTRRHAAYHNQHQPYYHNGARSHSTTSADAPKITFNEDEYTRITTPRQDVLFKKGYLSRRKPLVPTPSISSVEPGASTSAPSTPSTQSTSPEHHAHASELAADGDQMIPEALMFPNSFFDQNGIFYVNTALANFDGFGQMMMMPYGAYPPYGHIEYYNQVCLQHPYNHKGNSVDSQISDTPETTSPQNEPAQSSPEDSGKASMKDTGDSETAQQSADSCGSTGVPVPEASMLHNNGPHYIYPGYMFGSQMYHINGMNIQCGNAMTLGGPMDLSNKQKYKKKRRRKQRKPSGSTGTMATDYSEDEYSSDSEPASTSSQRASSGSSLMSNTNGCQEQWQDNLNSQNVENPPPKCDPLKSVLNTNCSEFIPKAQLLAKSSQLNTDVSEFIPQSYKDQKNAFEKQIENCLGTETGTACKKIEVAVQTKEVSHEENVPATNNSSGPVLTNGFLHKDSANLAEKHVVAEVQEVVEPVRKVQIICVEKPTPLICNAPRDDQWTTVKSTRSKNKKGRQEVSASSPTSPKGDVESENTFQMFVDGAMTPPPSEDDRSFKIEKVEEAIYFTSDDAIENIEEIISEDTNTTSPKKNVKPAKSKAKKGKKAKEQMKAKPLNQMKDTNGEDKKNKTKAPDKVNIKVQKSGKQISTNTTKSNLSQSSGPMPSSVEINHIVTEVKLNEEPIHVENKPDDLSEEFDNDNKMPESIEEICIFTSPTVTLTESTPDESPPNLDETIFTSKIEDVVNNEVINDPEFATENDLIVENATNIKLEIVQDLVASDETDNNTGTTVNQLVPSYDDLESPDISTFNSVPDITEDTPAVANELLMDEGIILAEGITKESDDQTPLYLTEAVRRWLSEQKEKSPEPVLREPDDPALALLLRGHAEIDGSGSSDPETDDGEDATSNSIPKNLKGNPLRASSVKRNEERVRAKRSRSTPPTIRHGRGQGETGDTDSDYLSDIQDDTRKRVAGITSEPDLLDCWEPDIVPLSVLSPAYVDQKVTEQAEDVLETYESVYGKSVDYDKLSASLGARRVLPPLRGEGVAPPCSGICCSVM